MTNDQARMTKEILYPNTEDELGHSGFVIDSSLELRR
jgi:hypothetical protein